MPSETSKNYIKSLLLAAAKNLGYELPNNDLTVPDARFGDYATNAALILAKELKRNPAEIAAVIAEEAKKLDKVGIIAEAKAVGGFINFFLSEKYLNSVLVNILSSANKFGAANVGAGQKVLVEYFQPNIAKPLHLGHLGTAIIGDCLFRIFEFEGFKTESDTHIGDWGTQFGLLLYAFKKYGDISVVGKSPIDELNKLYVKINQEAETDPQVRENGKAEFVKLEQGDEENRKLWKQFKDWSWQEFEIIYNELGIRRADNDWPESFFEDKMPAVLSSLKEKGLLKESQGAQIVDLEEYKLGIALVVKSDGGTTYLLRDLATYIYRKSQGFAKQYYVVDVRQSHTLAQTFKILELMGHITSDDEANHVAYGFTTLPDGAMSTRKGTIVGVKEFLQGVQEQALSIIEEKNPDLQNKEQVAKNVAAGAVKYFNLVRNIKSDIVFDQKKVISFEGNTGPYLQYTHARIHGILRKNQDPNSKNQINLKSEISNLTPEEHSVLRKLQFFPETVAQVTKDLQPNLLCNYLFELSQTFNAFYQEVPVLQEPDEDTRDFRLKLITATAIVLKNGLNLLGIEALEEM